VTQPFQFFTLLADAFRMNGTAPLRRAVIWLVRRRAMGYHPQACGLKWGFRRK